MIPYLPSGTWKFPLTASKLAKHFAGEGVLTFVLGNGWTDWSFEMYLLRGEK